MNHQKPVWAEKMSESPFTRSHFTDELQEKVMRRAGTGKPKRGILAIAASIVVCITVIVIGLSGNGYLKDSHSLTINDNWIVDKPFMVGDVKLIGKEGKFGLRRMNGDANEEFANLGKGIHYYIYFWGNADRFIGKYKLIATHKDTLEAIKLYEWPISLSADLGSVAQSGGKTGLDKPGLWKLEVYVNDIYFDSVIINVK